jgi:D-threo-aldose 1-dehydrogenase
MPELGAQTIALGRTDLTVSKLCFGTSALGDMPDTYGYGVDEHRAKKLDMVFERFAMCNNL